MQQKLPQILVPVSVKNPEFKRGDPMDTYYLPRKMMPAEVLMLNVNAGTMRCRSIDKSWYTQDFPISYFYEAYTIIENPSTD
jgi:hypothetical protein